MSLTVEQLLATRNQFAPIQTGNARRHSRRARPRYDGHLTVVRLGKSDGFVTCSVPGCRARGSGDKDYGLRTAAVELHVAGWSLGAFCEPHGREVRLAYDDCAPCEEWVSWVAALNPRVARRAA